MEMQEVRLADDRGRTRLDWLDSFHTFSFDQYYDADHRAFGPLRVINEDFISPGGGFGTHPHRDMEIITYVIEGQLQHKDSLGNGSIISPGEIQKMSAGTGILHSEFNASKENPVHLLQIWIVPDERSLNPKYEQEKFALTPGEWKLLGSPDGDGLISIRQQAKLYALSAPIGSTSEFSARSNSHYWIQVVQGRADINHSDVNAGDGLMLHETSQIAVQAFEQTELLLFEFST